MVLTKSRPTWSKYNKDLNALLEESNISLSRALSATVRSAEIKDKLTHSLQQELRTLEVLPEFALKIFFGLDPEEFKAMQLRDAAAKLSRVGAVYVNKVQGCEKLKRSCCIYDNRTPLMFPHSRHFNNFELGGVKWTVAREDTDLAKGSGKKEFLSKKTFPG